MSTTPLCDGAILQQAVHAAKIGLWDWDLRTNQVIYSPEWKIQVGHGGDEIANTISEWESRIHPDDLANVKQRIAEYLKNSWPDFEEQFRIRRKDGSWRWMLLRADLISDEQGQPARMIGCQLDITRQKLIEIELDRVNRALRLISGSNLTLIQLGDEATVLEKVCRLAVEIGGYRMAWVGYAEQDEFKTVRPVAEAGFQPGYLQSARITWADGVLGRGPGGTAIRTGRACIARNIRTDPSFEPWREAALESGYQSAISLPLRSEGRVFGNISIYAAEPDAFSPAEVRVLEELSRDLSFGLTVIRTRVERDRALEDLKESQKQLRLVIDTIPVMAWIVLPNGAIEFINLRWLEYSGLTLDEALKEPTQTIHPDDRPRVLEKWEKDRAAGVPSEDEMRLRRADGEYRWFLIRTVPLFDEQRKIVKWYGTSTDIEDRKRTEEALRESEARFREILELMPAAVYVCDKDGIIEHYNRTAAELWGRHPRIGDPVQRYCGSFRILQPDGALVPHEESPMASTLRSGTTVKNQEVLIERPDGSRLIVMVSIAALRNQKGEVMGAINCFLDITERRATEEALRETQAALTRAARTTIVGELTASIAHEVNQPLGAIVTNAGAGLHWLAGNPPHLTEAREAFQRIIRDGNRASQVIARIRSLLKKGRPAKAQFNLGEMIGEILALSETEAERRKVSVQTRLEPKLPPIIADRIQLQQVLLNMVMNSLDALSEVTGRPRTLTIGAELDSPDSVRVSVQDTGTGIDPQRMEKIFEPFHTTKAHGLGLGLSISRSIIESHGGRLWAVRNDGPGVTFQFTLPVDGNGSA